MDGRTLISLPSEVIQQILSYLDLWEAVDVAQTCRRMYQESYDDQVWSRLVNSHLAKPIATPGMFASFRDLYIAHHPRWFVAEKRIWFADNMPNGKLILARYNESSHAIEAFTVTATRRPREGLVHWEHSNEVIMNEFNPILSLDFLKPVLRLVPRTVTNVVEGAEDGVDALSDRQDYTEAVPMVTLDDGLLHQSFSLCRALPEAAISHGTSVWPPLRIPAVSRTRTQSKDHYQSKGHRSEKLSQISRYHFRIRKWVEGQHTLPQFFRHSLNSLPALANPFGAYAPHNAFRGETSDTFAALPPSVYTPTPEKPWQGIWCGDFNAHGCELILITQPDADQAAELPAHIRRFHRWLQLPPGWFRAGDVPDLPPPVAPAPPGWDMRFDFPVTQVPAGDGDDDLSGASDSASDDGDDDDPDPAQPAESTAVPPNAPTQTAQDNASQNPDLNHPPPGRLEAIKLTGDPNVPCGQYTFIAPDIGPAGFVRTADEAPFGGARIVRSCSHVAEHGFQSDRYMPSWLIMISHDRLAQYWGEWRFISFYQRVDLDALWQSRSAHSGDA